MEAILCMAPLITRETYEDKLRTDKLLRQSHGGQAYTHLRKKAPQALCPSDVAVREYPHPARTHVKTLPMLIQIGDMNIILKSAYWHVT